MPPEMSDHSTCPMLCRASQAGQTGIAACPPAQEIITSLSYFSALWWALFGLLEPNGDAKENNHCNHRIIGSFAGKDL